MNINAGTLQIVNGSTSGNTSVGATITNNAALVFNRSDSVTVDNIITVQAHSRKQETAPPF